MSDAHDWQELIERHLRGELSESEKERLAELLDSDVAARKDFVEQVQWDTRLPHAPSHADEWLAACKAGTPTGTHFGYSGPLTETVLLGTVAYRAGQKLQWDAENLKVTNCPEADRFIRRATRQGWAL